MGVAQHVVKGRDGHLGNDVSIGAFVTIGHRTTIGDRVTIYPGVFLGEDVTIGNDTVLHPNVSVLDGCRIGSRVIIHAGAVIGSDGFGYVQHEGRHHKIPQRGIVVIEDDVEIGANVTIDRATFGRTHVKQGTKIDNLVQIAHNVTVGEHGIIVAQVGIAGSTSIGETGHDRRASRPDRSSHDRGSGHDRGRSGNRKRRGTRCHDVRAACETTRGLFTHPRPGATPSRTV